MVQAEAIIQHKQLIADGWIDYQLLDSGHGRKLERFGSQHIIRPDPQAFWQPKTPTDQWQADAEFSGDGEEDGKGRWLLNQPDTPETWPMHWNGLKFEARRTAFRHMGIFQEHSVHWAFAQEMLQKSSHIGAEPFRVLNLFGYTGIMSLSCAQIGAHVTHLDASPKVNGYGKTNQLLSGLADYPIRWICDDALKFVAREIRRGQKYDAIILDPPKYGHGPKKEIWRFEQHINELLVACRALLSDKPLFLICTAYALRLSHIALMQAVSDQLGSLGGVIMHGDMLIPEATRDILLPTAIYTRWSGPI